MIRLAAFTDEISQDFAHACQVLNQFGAKGAEVRGVWDKGVHKLSATELREARRILDDNGLAACSIGSPFGKCELDDKTAIAEHMDILRRCSDAAHELGCTLIRGFAFWGPLRDVPHIWLQPVQPRPWDRMLTAFEPVPGILEEHGTVLGIENEYACWIGTAGHAREFVERLGSDRVRVIWDPANHVHDVEGGEHVPAFPDGYEAVKDLTVHVHIKDAAPTGDGGVQDVFITTGLVDWEAQLRRLHDDGYDGYVSLETHVTSDDFPESLRDDYGKYLEGEPREAASRASLAWLRDVLKRL